MFGRGRCRVIERTSSDGRAIDKSGGSLLRGGDAICILLFPDEQQSDDKKGDRSAKMSFCSVRSNGGGLVGEGPGLLEYDDCSFARLEYKEDEVKDLEGSLGMIGGVSEIVCSISGVNGDGVLELAAASSHVRVGVLVRLPEVAPLRQLTLLGPAAPNDVSHTQLQLQNRCAKRQLAGLLVRTNFAKDAHHSASATLKTSLGSYTIQSALPSAIMGKVMPTTNITICHLSPPSTHPKTQKPSAAATAIINTIRTIRLLSPLNVHLPRAFLLTGPPGVGKTHAVRTAIELSPHTKLISIRASELLSSSSTNASLHLQKLFHSAASTLKRTLALIFIDECDALLAHPAIPPTLAFLLDNLPPNILVVAATNRIDAFPSFLTRPGRFDQQISLSPPNATERQHILSSLLAQSQQSLTNEDLSQISQKCVGYVPADLMALVRRAAFLASSNTHISPLITLQILQNATNDVGASALRDAALSAPPNTCWDDIAGDAGGAKTSLQQAVIWPLTKQKSFQNLGLVPPRGILLHGPPGCAKTTLARAAAGASGIAFFSLSPADVYASSYVGVAEGIVRRAFSLARSAAPCILFFDEIDSIVGSNSNCNGHGMNRSQGRGNSAEARVLSTFLNEMDGVDRSTKDGVLVLGATNRPSQLDAALLRPGRFDKVIYVPPPDKEARKSIFTLQCQKWKKSLSPICPADSFDIDYLASDSVSGHMTGAEIVGACREAAMSAIREYTTTTSVANSAVENYADGPHVQQTHIEEALRAVHPLLSDKNILQQYSHFQREQKSS